MSVTGPYREAAIVLAEPLEPVPLPAFTSTRCAACGVVIANTIGDFYSAGSARVCHGRWGGWFGLRKCRETRPHVHLSHSTCGASWATAPFDPAARLT